MRHKAFVLISILCLPVMATAQEAINLTTPITIVKPPDIGAYSPGSLYFEVAPSPSISIILIYNGNVKTLSFDYPCIATIPPAAPNPCTTDTPAKVLTLINQLNTVNLSTRSLWRRIFDKLIVDFPSRFNGGATVQ